MKKIGLVPLVRASGFGSLPQLLQARASERALLKALDSEGLPIAVRELGGLLVRARALIGLFAWAGPRSETERMACKLGSACHMRDMVRGQCVLRWRRASKRRSPWPTPPVRLTQRWHIALIRRAKYALGLKNYPQSRPARRRPPQRSPGLSGDRLCAPFSRSRPAAGLDRGRLLARKPARLVTVARLLGRHVPKRRFSHGASRSLSAGQPLWAGENGTRDADRVKPGIGTT